MKNKSKQHSKKAKLHTSLLDSCFILDSLWKGDPERYTTPNIHLIPGRLLGAPNGRLKFHFCLFDLMLNVHSKQLRSCWDGQLLNHTVPRQAS